MKSQIDEKTMIPLSWAIIGLTTLFGPAVIGSMWVKGVNDRLSRIEAKLHIEPAPVAKSGFPAVLPAANAASNK